MRKYLGAVVAATAAAMVTAILAFASSDTVLSDGAANPNGTNTAVNSVITGGLQSGTNATFFTTSTGTTGVTCTTLNASATVLTDPPAPGTATLSLTGLSVSHCTSNVAGVSSVKSCTFNNLPYNISISAGGTGTLSAGSSGPIHFTCTFTTIFGQTITCGYHVHDSSGNITSFSNQQFDGDPGNSAQCPSTLFVTARVGPAVDSSNGNAAVFGN